MHYINVELQLFQVIQVCLHDILSQLDLKQDANRRQTGEEFRSSRPQCRARRVPRNRCGVISKRLV